MLVRLAWLCNSCAGGCIGWCFGNYPMCFVTQAFSCVQNPNLLFNFIFRMEVVEVWKS